MEELLDVEDTILLSRDSEGLWSWIRRGPHGHVLARGPEGWVSREAALADLRRANGYAGYRLRVGHS
jgi:hypothetical protein